MSNPAFYQYRLASANPLSPHPLSPRQRPCFPSRLTLHARGALSPGGTDASRRILCFFASGEHR